MGTINFNTLINKRDLALVNEPETEQEQEEQHFYNYELEEVKTEIKKYNFYYFKLVVDYGYYNGFYLRLEEENTKLIYQNYKEKTEAMKELTKIQKLLIKLIKNQLVWGQYPSWVYNKINTKETIKELKAIIKELKEETKTSYTERTAKDKNIFDIMKERS